MNLFKEALNLTADVNKLGIKNKVVLPFTAKHLELAVAVATNRNAESLVGSVLDFNRFYAIKAHRTTHDRINDMRKSVHTIERKNLSL